MADEQENREPTDDEIFAVMSSPELLAEHGYRLTPKGIMALVLMQGGASKEVADALSDALGDAIFNAGWTYLPPEGLDLEGLDDL
jgi:hypothetical protein